MINIILLIYHIKLSRIVPRRCGRFKGNNQDGGRYHDLLLHGLVRDIQTCRSGGSTGQAILIRYPGEAQIAHSRLSTFCMLTLMTLILLYG